MSDYILPLISKAEIAEDTMEFVFEKPKNFTFKAGQSIDMTIGTLVYSFSIAASPNEQIIRIAMRMRNSEFKKSLNSLPIGAKVRVQGPSGDFVLPKNTKQHIVMIAGGIGITPFYSMLKSRPSHKISLFYKNSFPARAAFLDELKKLNVLVYKLPITSYTLYYLAGPPGFVAKYRRILDEAGIHESFIRTEEFSGY